MKTQIAELITGDFGDSTLTFEVENKKEMVIQAGRYAVVPIDEYKKIVNDADASQEKALPIQDVRLSLSNIQEAATKALLKTRQSKGMETNNITERELELAERAFINGAIWAKNIIENNEA